MTLHNMGSHPRVPRYKTKKVEHFTTKYMLINFLTLMVWSDYNFFWEVLVAIVLASGVFSFKFNFSHQCSAMGKCLVNNHVSCYNIILVEWMPLKSPAWPFLLERKKKTLMVHKGYIKAFKSDIRASLTFHTINIQGLLKL